MEDFDQKEIDEVFSDVTPISTKEDFSGMCVLSFDSESTFSKLLFIVVEQLVGYLRACVKSGEISKRVYYLTEQVIMENMNFITAW